MIDEGGDLWHRRIEEIDAAACALCAHRYARRATRRWLGDPGEGVDRAARALDPGRVPAPGRDAAGGAPPAARRVARA